MKALVYYGPKDLRVTEIEDPKISKDEVFIKVRACGICGSDVHGYLGVTGRRIPPMIMGHEFSGEIIERGEAVKNLSIGDRVTVYPVRFCEVCSACKKGLTNLCENKSFLGVMNVNGAMAEYISVPSYIVVRLPDSLNYLQGAMIEPLAVAYRAVKNSPNLLNKNVLIVGAGTIGLLVLILLRPFGVESITVVDVNSHRLKTAKELGADFTINPNKDEPKNGFLPDIDLVFEAVGSTSSVTQAMNRLKPGGACIWIGNSAKNIELDMQNIVTRELKVFGTYIYTYEEFVQSIGLISKLSDKLDKIISKIISLEEAPEIFNKLIEKDTNLIKVIIRLSS